MPEEKIEICIRNEEETEAALKKFIQCRENVDFLSESKSGKHILVFFCGAYVVFEKSPEDSVHSIPSCRYVGSAFVCPENGDCTVDDVIWKEHGGCVAILMRDKDGLCKRPSVNVVFDEYAYEFSERRFKTMSDNPQFLERKKLVRSYMGKTVEIHMDRPLGCVHEKEHYTLTYPINYGFIPEVIGGDGEELDVYLLGVNEPVDRYTAKIIGIVHRKNDAEDKLVAAPEGMNFTKEEIAERVDFQEKYYDSFIETETSFFECSLKDCFVDRKLPDELEHHLLNKLLCHCEYEIFRFPSWKEFDSLDEFKPYRDKPDDYHDVISHRPEFICSPRTLFLALWRRYLRVNSKLSDDLKINLRFYFRKGNLMMKVESVEESR